MPDRREGEPDRRERNGAWSDPRLWVSICGLLLVIVMALLGYISAQLRDINKSVAETNAQLQSTRDAMLVATTQQGGEIKSIERRLTTAENQIETQRAAYNFNFTTRLAQIEARLGIKAKE